MSTADRWKRAKAVLEAALGVSSDARPAYLTEACGGDAALREEVEALLDAHDRSDRVFEAPALDDVAHVLAASEAGSLIGRTVAHYRVLSQLGIGGMAAVYLAHDTRLDREVALKVLDSHLTRDPERLRRFHGEASAASRLNHPNILTIHEMGEDAGVHYIAAERVDGVTLRTLMAQRRLTAAEAVDLTLQAASALAAAHAAGIVHRDIKPENIMLRRDGYLKVLDFGIAKLASDSRFAGSTDPGTLIGTVMYMSPEQARGVAVDPRSDVWSLGVVLYEMVTGRLPFEAGSSADMLVAILQRAPRPIDDDLPAGLIDVLGKALRKDRNERYASVEDFAADLRAIGQATMDTVIMPRPAISSRVNNLSTRPGLLVGRAGEVADAVAQLRSADVRLLTLTGPGGTGKTRLAHQIAREVAGDFAHGVFVVPLAPISSHAMVASAIGQVLGVQETSQRGFAEGLEHYLRDKTMLLVLDNFEQVIDAASLVAALLAACDGLKVLVTSRAALHVRGEHELRVPPLALPPPGESQSPAELMKWSAAVLFLQRLLAVSPGFQLTDENAPAVAAICRQLDGLPLALELAAARTKLLSLDELLARMNDRLALLKVRARDIPERQQTMRAAIAWSYDLLSPDEKTLFHRLSVFAGGCTLAAAEAVCERAGGQSIEVLDALDALVEENLVQKKEAAGGTLRFVMLETIREFGVERLEESGESQTLRRRHLAYFVTLAEEAEPHLMSAAREPWLTRLDAEHNNVRASLDWAAGNGEIESALRLCGALRWYWYFRGHIGEGYLRASELLAMPGASERSAARARALLTAGSLAFYYSDPGAALPLMEESVALGRELGDRRHVAYGLVLTSLSVSIVRRDFAAARTGVQESVSLFRELGDRWGLALSLNYAGVILWSHRGLEAEAAVALEESVALFSELGDGWGASGAILYLAAIRQEQGDVGGARARYEEFLALTRASKDTWRLASGLDILAELVRSEGDHARADELVSESLTLQKKLGRSLNLKKTWERMRGMTS